MEKSSSRSKDRTIIVWCHFSHLVDCHDKKAQAAASEQLKAMHIVFLEGYQFSACVRKSHVQHSDAVMRGGAKLFVYM